MIQQKINSFSPNTYTVKGLFWKCRYGKIDGVDNRVIIEEKHVFETMTATTFFEESLSSFIRMILSRLNRCLPAFLKSKSIHQ